MFCSKCGKFVPNDELRKMAKVKNALCPFCHAVFNWSEVNAYRNERKRDKTLIEVATADFPSNQGEFPIDCPFCGHNRGYIEIIKTGYADESDTILLCCGKCRKTVRREGGPVGWG